MFLGVMRETVLPAHLAELARPVGQQSTEPPLSVSIVEAAAVGMVEASAHEPAPAQLVIGRG